MTACNLYYPDHLNNQDYFNRREYLDHKEFLQLWNNGRSIDNRLHKMCDSDRKSSQESEPQPDSATAKRPPTRLAHLDNGRRLLAPRTLSGYAPLPDIGQSFRSSSAPQRSEIVASTVNLVQSSRSEWLESNPCVRCAPSNALDRRRASLPVSSIEAEPDERIAVKYTTHRLEVPVHMSWPLQTVFEHVKLRAKKEGLVLQIKYPVFVITSPSRTLRDMSQ
eukprot:gene4504-6728_t